MCNEWMSKNSGVKFSGEQHRSVYASWNNLRWGDGYPTHDLCGLMKDFNVRDYNYKGLLAPFFI